MMETGIACYETLKTILKHIRNPGVLDDHPWTRSLIVQEVLSERPQWKSANPGQQLVGAIASLFSYMQPSTPPRRGKRLDPRWGEYGLLAALYFAPLNHGTPVPTSLLDAWNRIDTSILYCVYGKPAEMLSREQVQRYRLVGDEIEYGSTSTLSDWHKKGLQRLTDILVSRERFLSFSSSRPSVILEDKASPTALAKSIGHDLPRQRNRPLWMVILLIFCTLLLLGAVKARDIYTQGRVVYEDVASLQKLVLNGVEVEMLDPAAYPLLLTLKNDLSAFKEEAQPLLWLCPRLSWIPIYGGDLAAAPELIEMTEHLVNASEISLQAARPLLNEFGSQNSTMDPAGLTTLLVQAQPPLEQARLQMDQALALRNNMDAQRLSPRLHSLLVEELDPVLTLADEGLALVTALPVILGASEEGPKTYLLLAQNEDELRPTGGFITSVGNLVLQNGQVISLGFEQVDDQEDWSKPYPPAPWQLQQYMNSRVLILRDANWYTDFPTAAQMAENLYAYTHSHSVDGVIAFDQRFLVMLLAQIGPLDVEGAPTPITAENVIAYMRSAKTLPAGEPVPAGWHRKEFISRIANAILTKLLNGNNHNWLAVGKVLSQALAERHLLLQIDDPVVALLLAKQGWDNSVRPGVGDYLMVTDTNIGFNKTNAVVDVSLSYDVDLTDVSAPKTVLTVTHTNNANPNVPCVQWNTGQFMEETSYPIDRCYWNYLRVYKQEGVELLESSPHAVPDEWMLLGQGVPARVDELQEELAGLQGFGTLLVLPGGQSLDTGFRFALPPATLSSADDASGRITYHLKVQKQPGTLATPFNIKIVLPNGATLLSVSRDAVSLGNHLSINTVLRTDVEFDVLFSIP